MGSLGIDIGGTSVKVCLLDGDQPQTARSDVYANPTREVLIEAIRETVSKVGGDSSSAVGLCLPGRRSAGGDSIEVSVNMPCLNGWRFDELLADSLENVPTKYSVMSDVQAAGDDFIRAHTCSGRTAIIAIGTGVGLAIFDGSDPVGIGLRGIGHLGMMDMGRLGEVDVIGPDGSKNTLESYVGARAIENRFPDLKSTQIANAIGTLARDEPFIVALVRAIRIVHAIYVPDQVVLIGGVGIALQPQSMDLIEAINNGLTVLANADWKLMFGDSPYHSACGAARSVGSTEA